MSSTAQIIVAIGIAILLVLLGCLGVIWSIRCDPQRPHYRLPAIVALIGPVAGLILAYVKLR